MSLMQIGLESMRFRAYHGCYPAERAHGNDFVVSLSVKVEDRDVLRTDALETTTDYAGLYAICREEMEQPKNLLETVTALIASRIMAEFPEVQELTIKIMKERPPLTGEVGGSWVSRTVRR